MTVMKFLFLGIAGAAGALARFWLSELVKDHFSWLPLGTWAVNVVGCFFFGLIWVLAEESNLVSQELRFFTLVGFMGAFTTFSSYVFESIDLVRAGAVIYALVNIVGQNALGVAALLAGMAIGRLAG